MATTSKALTLEAFLKLPDEKPALEFEFGRVIQKPWPNAKHSILQLTACTLINAFTERPKVALAFPELRATFGGHSYVPDVSVYLWDRIPLDDAGEPVDDLTIPPHIALEIASPEQSRSGLRERCVWYVENGVAISLLVDPADRSITHFVARQSPKVLTEDDALELDEVIPGLTMSVQLLFGSLKLR
jgi:Uma2 family endonuclease